jgi:hypothetical protein
MRRVPAAAQQRPTNHKPQRQKAESENFSFLFSEIFFIAH